MERGRFGALFFVRRPDRTREAGKYVNFCKGLPFFLQPPRRPRVEFPIIKGDFNMRKFTLTLTAASALALAACQSPQADKVEDQAEAKSDAIDAQADAMPEGTAKEAMENKADAVEAAGEAKADAIDNGTVPPPAASEAEKK